MTQVRLASPLARRPSQYTPRCLCSRKSSLVHNLQASEDSFSDEEAQDKSLSHCKGNFQVKVCPNRSLDRLEKD